MNKICSKCKEDKLISEFNRDDVKRDGYCSQCRDCQKHHYEANKDQIAEKKKQYYELNKEHITKSMKQYSKNNPAKFNAKNAKRRATKLQATPNWLTSEELQQIVEFYKEAQVLKLATGEGYHVDHIVPLQGKNVCGLHVPWNLQIIEASKNRKKSNKVTQD